MPLSRGLNGIRVQRETVIVVEDARELSERRTGSPTTTISSARPHEMDGELKEHYTRPKTFRRLSDASSILTDIFRPETSEEMLRRKIKRANDRDTSRALIDFLRNTTPPPHNYMSFPDSFESKPKSKTQKRFRQFWSCSFFQSSKRNKKDEPGPTITPITVRLPKTTVVERTTGGHRHMAISIPAEYDYAHIPDEWQITPSREFSHSPVSPVASPRNLPFAVLTLPGEERRSAESHAHSLATECTTATCDSDCFKFDDGMFSLLPSPESPMLPASRAGVHPVAEPSARGRNQKAEPARSRSPSRSQLAGASVGSQFPSLSLPPELTLLVPKGSLSGLLSVKSDGCSDNRKKEELVVSSGCAAPRNPPPCPSHTKMASMFPPPDPPPPQREPTAKPSCTFHITPVMTVIDVQPSSGSTTPHLRPQRSLTTQASKTYLPPEVQVTEPAPLPQRSKPPPPPPRSPRVRHKPDLADIRSTASVERLLRTRRSRAGSGFDPSTTLATKPSMTTISRSSASHSSHFHASRSASHQDLLRRYQELRSGRDRDLQEILHRLDQLELNHDRWLAAMIPLVETLTKRLLACPSSSTSPQRVTSPSASSATSLFSSYATLRSQRSRTNETDSDATPRPIPGAHHRRHGYGHHQQRCSQPHPSPSAKQQQSIDSFDWGKTLSHQQKRPKSARAHYPSLNHSISNLTTDSESSAWDPRTTSSLLASAGLGTREIATDRLPSRHGLLNSSEPPPSQGDQSLLGDGGAESGKAFAERQHRMEQLQQAGQFQRRPRTRKGQRVQWQDDDGASSHGRSRSRSRSRQNARPVSQDSQLSGMETLEPVMNELLISEVTEETRGIEDPLGGHH
ncbi:hypothetical protein QBC35DRAFT_494155 [Podospora australis]|uniref:Uncharacterized protein n=1 Tax=Podospora australis TaxID=1536484 RepID=A0AAN6WZC6_9PEZI|nr:hypothetical protein QBC35DRAFT_494155 [Podospora australis]